MIRRHRKAFICPRCKKTGDKPKVFIAGLRSYHAPSGFWNRGRRYCCNNCAISLASWWRQPQEGAVAETRKATAVEAPQRIERRTV